MLFVNSLSFTLVIFDRYAMQNYMENYDHVKLAGFCILMNLFGMVVVLQATGFVII